MRVITLTSLLGIALAPVVGIEPGRTEEWRPYLDKTKNLPRIL